jgi:hypothetical protein
MNEAAKFSERVHYSESRRRSVVQLKSFDCMTETFWLYNCNFLIVQLKSFDCMTETF